MQAKKAVYGFTLSLYECSFSPSLLLSPPQSESHQI
jgi:hypothetical protein